MSANRRGSWLPGDELMHAAMRDDGVGGIVGFGHAGNQFIPSLFGHGAVRDQALRAVAQRPVPESLVRSVQIVRVIGGDVNKFEAGFLGL